MRGERLDLLVDQVVEGDVVLFQAGDQIYADAKILDGSIMVDESQLTGEADEIPKGENQQLMSGSFVISGQAVAVLEQVGDASYINQLSLSAKKGQGTRRIRNGSCGGWSRPNDRNDSHPDWLALVLAELSRKSRLPQS